MNTLNVALIQNQQNAWTYRRDDISSVAGWSASMEWRLSPTSADGVAIVTLTNGSGITLSAAPTLVAQIVLTETQTDTIVAAARDAGVQVVFASLKLTSPTAVTEQQFVLRCAIAPTPTA